MEVERFIAFGLLPVVYIAALGWGRLLENVLYGRVVDKSSYTVALGLLVWGALGAFVNHASIAVPLVFDALLIAGAAFAIPTGYRFFKTKPGLSLSLDWAPVLIALATGIFFAWTLLPTNVFNFHDDFYKYLPRVIRMLQTGTLAGDDFDLAGLDSLGILSFYQGFFIAHLPFYYINAFDAVFCLSLAGLLLNDLGRRLQIHWVIRSLAVAALMVYNAQIVNVAAVYSAIAMIIALSMSTLFFLETIYSGRKDGCVRPALPIGLFVPVIASLKSTLIPYACAFPIVLLILMLLQTKTRRLVLLPAGWTLLISIALFLAWGSLYASKFDDFVTRISASTGVAASNLVTDDKTESLSYLTVILNRGDLFYGGHIHQYLGFIAAIFVLSLISLIYIYRYLEARERIVPAATTGIAAFASAIGIMIGVYGIDVDQLARYNAPVLIASLLTSALLLYGGTLVKARPHRVLSAISKIGVVIVVCFPLVSHADLWWKRVKQVATHRHLLSFPVSKKTLGFMDAVFSDGPRDLVASIQERIPVGATALVWVTAPFHFDFSRNVIYTLASPGRLKQIAHVPESERVSLLADRLHGEGVEYVFWEYRGPPKERSRHKSVVSKALAELARSSLIVYKDSNWIVFSVK